MVYEMFIVGFKILMMVCEIFIIGFKALMVVFTNVYNSILGLFMVYEMLIIGLKTLMDTNVYNNI